MKFTETSGCANRSQELQRTYLQEYYLKNWATATLLSTCPWSCQPCPQKPSSSPVLRPGSLWKSCRLLLWSPLWPWKSLPHNGDSSWHCWLERHSPYGNDERYCSQADIPWSYPGERKEKIIFKKLRVTFRKLDDILLNHSDCTSKKKPRYGLVTKSRETKISQNEQRPPRVTLLPPLLTSNPRNPASWGLTTIRTL